VICGEAAPPLHLDAAPPRRGGPRLPAPPHPDTYERQYRAALAPMLGDLGDRTRALIAALGDFTVEDAARVDPKRAAALRARIEAMRAAVLGRWTEAQIIRAVPLGPITQGVDTLHRRATMAQLRQAIELSPRTIPEDAVALIKASDGAFSEAKAERWARANAALIKGLAEDHVDRVARIAEAAVRHGSRAEVIAGELREATGIAGRRGRMIARDQIASLQGQVAQARQTRLGVERYRWRTVGDTRVRTEHAAREGRIFAWDAPPPDGHPGAPINCRCYPEPVLDDILAGLARER
jgi:SPP1 gp7 family putative phage head morphogenesis protein